MRGRIAALITALVLLGASLFTVTAHAQGTPTGSQQIWCGLWVGASLHFSDGDIGRCVASLKAGQMPASTTSTSSSTSSSETNTTAPAQSYVALGDSVAAGLGLPMSPNASSQDVQCGRSPAAYPNIVASRQNLHLTNLACQGATVGDLVTQQHMSGPNPSAQLSNAFANGTKIAALANAIRRFASAF